MGRPVGNEIDLFSSMSSFKGQAEYSIDSKGRVAIPAKMRNAMHPEAQNTFIVTRGFEGCIDAYPLDAWQRKEEEVSKLNMYQADSRGFVRSFMRFAEDASLDGQGRITLPKGLMEFAGVNEKALIIGAFDHIEIWDPDVFEQYASGQTEDYSALAERVMTR
jgi:MraZ protein